MLIYLLATILLQVQIVNASLVGQQPVGFLSDWQAETVVSEDDVEKAGLDNCFRSEKISDEVFNRMWLKSWKKDCTLNREDLRYLKILHRNADGFPQLGEMVVHATIADRVLVIFRKLYDAGYRIERMVLVDNYDADDERSMQANNTSGFNYRLITTSTTQISNHGLGLAIDLNPLYNPYVKRTNDGNYHIAPAAGAPYAFDRETRTDIPYKIDQTDLAYRLFISAGFQWGGSWTNRKDYQHFEFNPE